MIYLQLFYEFFKVGLFSVGGGMATIPFLQDLGARTNWFTPADLADMIAVSESTPGPIGVNMSTYVGFTCAGVPGAIIGVLGLVTPSVIVILIVAGFLKKFRENRVVEGVFSGLRPASTGLIAAAGWSVALIALFHTVNLLTTDGIAQTTPYPAAILIAVAVFVCLRIPALKKVHPILYIVVAAILGAVLQL